MADESKTPAHHFSIYLIKEGYDTPSSTLKSEANLINYSIGRESSSVAELFIKPSRPKLPKWTKFFKNHLNTNEFGLTKSVSAVLIANVDGRIFAVAFGQGGRFLLNQECYEERFGLKVALNCIGENNIRCIDKRTFDAISRHSFVQGSRESTAQAFGLDIEQDLLRGVTGTPSDSTLGRRMSGKDSLSVIVSTELDNLPALISRYYNKYLDKSYKKSFPWVDQISEITNSDLKGKLDDLLVCNIKDGKLERIWMAVPEVVRWERVCGFRYSGSSPAYHDIHLSDFLEFIPDVSVLTKETLTKKYVKCVDNDWQPLEVWQAYQCIYCELSYKGDIYLLSGGKWYCLTRNFVKEVDEAYKSIPRYDRELPEYTEDDESEATYNKRVVDSDPGTFALMDRKIISIGGGYNKVEFCDLYTRDKDMVHVKRYGSSSVLSHLFSQGLVSSELFQTDPLFRKKVDVKLPGTHKLDDVARRPRDGEYRIVFAVVSDEPGDLTLPFFSRLNLKHAVRRLQGYGFNVALTKIPVSEKLTKLKKCKPAKIPG